MLFLNGLTDWTVWLILGDALRGLYETSSDEEEEELWEPEEEELAEPSLA